MRKHHIVGVLENELPEQRVVWAEGKNQQKVLILHYSQSSVGALGDVHWE